MFAPIRYRCWGLAVVVCLLPFTIVMGQTPPAGITYGPSRQSTGWVMVHGAQSPVDQGIEFEGKIAYLTLMFDVVVVDAKTKKTQWSDSVGAFWDTLSIVRISKRDEAPRWAVELGSTSQPAYKQRYELETGKKLELIGAPGMPAGKLIKPRKEWTGSGGKQAEKLYRLITTATAWSTLREELFAETAARLPEGKDIDFSKEVLLVCYAGQTSNWNGISVELAVEDKERLLIRLHRHTYQSLGKGQEEHPYGVFVLPRLTGKEYVLEYNRQNLINGPALWKEFLRLKIKE